MGRRRILPVAFTRFNLIFSRLYYTYLSQRVLFTILELCEQSAIKTRTSIMCLKIEIDNFKMGAEFSLSHYFTRFNLILPRFLSQRISFILMNHAYSLPSIKTRTSMCFKIEIENFKVGAECAVSNLI